MPGAGSQASWVAEAPSYTQWLGANRQHACVAKLEVAECPATRTSAIRSRLRGAFDDAATPDMSVWLCVDGRRRGRWDVGDGWRDFEQHPGQFVVAPAGRPILLDAAGEVEFVGVAFPWTDAHSRAKELGLCAQEQFGRLHNAVLDDAPVRGLVLAMHQELRAGCPSGKLFLESLQMALLARLSRLAVSAEDRGMRTRVSARLTTAQIERVRSHVLEHIASSISMAELSKLVYLSPAHFARCFKLSTGLSPHEYVTRQRVALAQDLLRGSRGDLSIGQVAAAVGFCDQSHLSRHFRRVVGVSPACWRSSG